MATLQNIGKLKYRGKDGQWHPLPVVVQDAGGGVSTISGKGAPTSATQGKVNQLYRDEDTQKLYICTATDGGYTWAEVSGGSVDVDDTLTKAGYAADAKAAGDAIERKIDKAQGVENAGKVLGVDEEGNAVPEDKPVQALAGSAAPTTATAGVVGQEYYVIVDNAVIEMYVCTSALIGSYTWDKVEFGGGAYTLPTASSTTLGGVKPIAKTDAMTQGVGVDAEGALWTAPYIEGYELVFTETIAEDVASYTRTTDKDGNTFDLTDILVIIFTKPFAESTNQFGRALGFLPITRWGHYTLCGISDTIKSGGTEVGCYDVVYAKVIDGYQVSTRYYRSQNYSNVFGTMQERTGAGETGIQFYTDATKLMQINRPQGNFTCLKIVGYTQPLISAGTIISLYKQKGT